MQRLGHRAEVRLDPRRERCRQSQRCRSHLRRQSQQMAARGGRTEHAERCCRMPALLVVMEIDTASDARLGLPSRDVGGNERAPIDRTRFRESKQGRQDRCRRMAAQRVAAVIEIQRVRRGAIDQRRIQRCHALFGAKYQAWAARRGHSCHDARTRLACTSERAADRVDDCNARPMHRLMRQSGVADAGNPFSEGCGDGHGCPPALASGCRAWHRRRWWRHRLRRHVRLWLRSRRCLRQRLLLHRRLHGSGGQQPGTQ